MLSLADADLFSDVLSTFGIGGSHPATETTEAKVDQATSSSEPSITDYAKDMLGLKYKEPTEVPEGKFPPHQHDTIIFDFSCIIFNVMSSNRLCAILCIQS